MTEWLRPESVAEAVELRAEHGDGAHVLAGGTFLGVLLNQGFVEPERLLSLSRVDELRELSSTPERLRLGAMVTHRRVERDPATEGWPALRRAFGLVASQRVRNQATVGGVLADADYASDPPAMLAALGATVELRSPRRAREVSVEELILDHYETCIAADELLVGVTVPAQPERAAYRKFRSRSSEDRPCVAVAATRAEGALRVVVGGVASRPQHFPDACELAAGADLDEPLARRIGELYAERIDPISDGRGSGAYRRRVIAVEVRRAILELAG
ncbi:MAG: xanthine dehydrogenase family protein subunit M [Solirubrobacterales bacterium]